METGIITGVLAISLAFMNPSNTYIQTTSQEVSEMSVYHVKEGDSLASIAKDVYGSEDFWTTIWNDNDWIAKPNLIEKNYSLEIRKIIPTEPEELKKELVEKSAIKTTTQFQPQVTQSAQTPSQTQAIKTGDNLLTESQIIYLGQCEAGMDPAKNTGNGYFGAFQFSYETWKGMGTSYERADLAPIEVQKDAVQRLLKKSSIFNQFPGCSRKMQALGII